MSYNATLWPPLQLPRVSASTLTGSIVTIRTAQPIRLPQITPYRQTWTPSAPPTNNTTRVSSVTTQQRTNAFFGIINLQLSGQSP